MLGQDVRFGFRMLGKNSGTTMVAVLTLALALGVNTAIFSVLNATLWRPLPVPGADRLVILTDPNASLVLAGMLTGERSLLTFPEFTQLRDQMKTVSGLCAAQLTLERWPVELRGSSREEVRGRLVSENYFSVMGVQPVLGRLFRQDDATGAGKDPYAVISYNYWQRRFGGNRAILGTSLQMYHTAFRIIGVTAKGFRGETVGQEPDIWLPLMMQSLFTPGSDGLLDMLPRSRDKFMWLHVLGRRKSGESIQQVQAEVTVLFRRIIDADYPTTMQPSERKEALRQYIAVKPLETGAFHGRKEFSEQWMLLLGLAGLVLLVACANVTNLLLARAAARTQEVAIRLAIGAARKRLIRQFMTESLLLAVLAGGSGMLVAVTVTRALLRMLLEANQAFTITVGLDVRVLGFSSLVALAAGLFYGVAPALRATRINLSEDLREGGRGAIGSRNRRGLANTLVIAQVALSLMLAIGAGLFLRTLWNLQSVALGYPKDNLLLVQVDSSHSGYVGGRASILFRNLARGIGEVPGVRSASYSDRGLFSGFDGAFPIWDAEGFTSKKEPDGGSTGDSVGPGYFSTVGIPILLGREFGPRDMPGPPRVCLINEAFAKLFFEDRNPIGRHFMTGLSDADGNNAPRRLEVIGVAKDARVHSLREPIEPIFYVPGGGAWFEVRAAGDPIHELPAVRQAIFAVNGNLAVPSARTLTQTLNLENAQPRFIAQLATLFGILALILAAVGVYSLLSYSVARRTNEIGIRLALGADGGKITGMILRETGSMMMWGLIAGAALTAGAVRLLSTQLYGTGTAAPRWSLARYEQVESATELFGITAADSLTLAVVVGILCVVGLMAAYLPAKRAASVDPVEALRG